MNSWGIHTNTGCCLYLYELIISVAPLNCCCSQLSPQRAPLLASMLRCRSLPKQGLHLSRCKAITVSARNSPPPSVSRHVRTGTPTGIRAGASAAGALSASLEQTHDQERYIRALRRIAWSMVYAGAVAALCVLASTVSGCGLFASSTTAGGTFYPALQ